MKSTTYLGDGDDKPEKIPDRKVLRVLNEVTKAPNIHGETILPKRSPKESRRFREQAEAAENGQKQDLHALFSQFVDFMSKAIDKYGDEPQPTPAEKKSAARIYTPCSDGESIPDIKAEPQIYKSEITKGKVYFNCPACVFPTAVFEQYAGEKTRCPRCYSAIRAPHPGKNIAGQNLENDIDSVLNPEEFTAALPRRSSVATILPIPKINTALSTAAALVFFAATIGAARLAVHTYSPNVPIAVSGGITSEADAPETSVVVLQSRAESLVSQFMEEPDWHSRSEFVRDRKRVAPLMKEYYRTPKPNDVPGQHNRRIKSVASGFYEHLNSSIQYTKVQVSHPSLGIPPSHFIVEHTPVGDYIEWESSVAYNPLPLEDLLIRKAGQIQSLRVLAYQDDYFNYTFNDDMEYICVRVQFADDPENMAYAYLRADDIQAPKLLHHIRGTHRDHMKQLSIEVRLTQNAAQSRQMEIVSVGEDHWRWDGGINPEFIVDGAMAPLPID